MSVKFYPNYIFVAGFDATAEPSILNETYTCSGGETPGAGNGPAYDLIDNRSTRIITIDSSGQTTDPTIDIDLTVSISDVDFVIIDNHNLGTDVAWVTVTRNNGGTAQTISTAYSGTRGVASAAVSVESSVIKFSGASEDGLLLINKTADDDDNWEITMAEEAASTHQADITIGEIGLGVKCVTTYSANARPLESYQYQGVDITQSLGGQKYATKRFGAQRAWRLTWDLITDTDKTNLEAMFDVVDGQTYPLWVDFGDAATPKLHFVRFMQDRLDFQKQTHGIYTLTIDLQEEL